MAPILEHIEHVFGVGLGKSAVAGHNHRDPSSSYATVDGPDDGEITVGVLEEFFAVSDDEVSDAVRDTLDRVAADVSVESVNVELSEIENSFPARGDGRVPVARRAVERRARPGYQIRRRVHVRVQRHDVLATPTLRCIPPKLDRTGATNEGLMKVAGNTLLISITGFPAASVPGVPVDGVPVGVQLVGPPLAEADVLRAAYRVERTIGN